MNSTETAGGGGHIRGGGEDGREADLTPTP